MRLVARIGGASASKRRLSLRHGARKLQYWFYMGNPDLNVR
jgi:hypothetical protein